MNITGLHGCNCHPFSNWESCEFAHKRRFADGTQIRDRCTGKTGVIAAYVGGGYHRIHEHPFPAWPNQTTVTHAVQIEPTQ